MLSGIHTAYIPYIYTHELVHGLCYLVKEIKSNILEYSINYY